jgi:hypothetical protein
MKEADYIPCGKSMFYRHYKDCKEGKPIVHTEWSSRGRPQFVDDSSLANMIKDMMSESCRTYGCEGINKDCGASK